MFIIYYIYIYICVYEFWRQIMRQANRETHVPINR